MTESFKWFYIVILFSAPNSNTRRYLIIGSGLGIRTPNSCSMNALKKDCCLGIYQCHAYKRVIPFHQSAILFFLISSCKSLCKRMTIRT